MLNKSGKSGHSCRVPDLNGKAASFEDDICCGSFIDRFDEVQECSLHPYTLKHFNQERTLYLVKCFFCINREDHVVLLSSLIDLFYHID